jgi:ribosomal protein S18 acetylase RimI-like enzyme
MTNDSIIIQQPECGHPEPVERILRELPEWFGMEASLLEYVDAARTMPSLLAFDQGRAVGFLTIKRHFPESAEVFCVGILPAYHRRGIGSRLQAEAERWLASAGCRYVQVKTLAEAAKSESYARTRKFYRRMGFTPLEVFPDLWEEWNPCLMLVKQLDG